MAGIVIDSNGGIPSAIGIRICPPRIHHAIPYKALHIKPFPTDSARAPKSHPKMPPMTALLNR